MKPIPRTFLLATAVFTATVSLLAQSIVEHGPRDGDRLHPGLAGSNSLIISVSNSSRTVRLDPQSVSFDGAYDASPYVDGDTISYVQFATKHRFLLRGDTLSYLGYENRATDFRLDTPAMVAAFPLKEGASVRTGWSGHMFHCGSMILRHVRGTSVSSVEEGWTLTDGADSISDATRLLWKLDMAYADSDSIDAEMPDSVASEMISEMQVDVKAMLSERLLTERAMWFSEDARYPVLTDSRISHLMLDNSGAQSDTIPVSMLTMHYPPAYQYADIGEGQHTAKPAGSLPSDSYPSLGDNVCNGEALTIGEAAFNGNTVTVMLSPHPAPVTVTLTLFSDSGIRLTEPTQVCVGRVPLSCSVEVPHGWSGVMLLRIDAGEDSHTQKIIK